MAALTTGSTAEAGEPSAPYPPAAHTPRSDAHPGTTCTPVLRALQPQPGNNRDAREVKVQGSRHRVRHAVKGRGWGNLQRGPETAPRCGCVSRGPGQGSLSTASCVAWGHPHCRMCHGPQPHQPLAQLAPSPGLR